MKQDLRYITTENKIRTAFFELIEEVSFEKINVKMIVNRANMNRTTFYLHYKDKYDLVDTIEKELFTEISQRIMEEFETNHEYMPTMKIISILSGYLNEKKELLSLLAGEKGDPLFLEKHFNRAGNTIGKIIVHTGDPVADEYMIEGIKGMLMAFLKTWFRRNLQETPEEFTDQIKKSLAKYEELFGSILTTQ